MNLKFYIVDAFTETPFGGNTAGVVLLDSPGEFPGDDLMQRIAAELRYSETAFLRSCPAEGRGAGHNNRHEFETRYFTPEGEVDLCGHATIATFSVLRKEGILQEGQTVTNKTLAGDLAISATADGILMEMAPPRIIGVYDKEGDIQELYCMMGVPESAVSLADALLPAVVSTGLPDILLPVASPQLLSQLQPDMDALTAYSKKRDVVGVHAFSLLPSGSGHTALCRNFAPLYGIPEEAATGTSNGALAYYLYRHGLLAEGETARFLQGREMNRPSLILAKVAPGQDGPTVTVGGRSVILSQGTLFL